MEINRIGNAGDPAIAPTEEQTAQTEASSASGIAETPDSIESPDPNFASEISGDAGFAEGPPNLFEATKIADHATLPSDDLKGSPVNPKFPITQLQSQTEPLAPLLTEQERALPDENLPSAANLSISDISTERLTSIERELVLITMDKFNEAIKQYNLKGTHTPESLAQAKQLCMDIYAAISQNPPEYESANQLIEQLKNLK